VNNNALQNITRYITNNVINKMSENIDKESMDAIRLGIVTVFKSTTTTKLCK